MPMYDDTKVECAPIYDVMTTQYPNLQQFMFAPVFVNFNEIVLSDVQKLVWQYHLLSSTHVFMTFEFNLNDAASKLHYPWCLARELF